MGKTFILLMLGDVIWFDKSILSSSNFIALIIDRMLIPIFKNTFALNLLNERFAGFGRFPIYVLKNNLVKTGNDYMLQKQNLPVDANT